MGIIDKIAAFFSGQKLRESDATWIAVRCNRCGEVIRARINLFNDLSTQYGEDDSGEITYYCHKQLMGEGMDGKRCFQRIEVELTFDSRRKLINREVSGGTFVE